MRVKLRSFYTPEQRVQIYVNPYRHEMWEDHRLRVARTAELLRNMKPLSVADLSCGDGAIVAQAELICPVYMGDITPGWQYAGPIEETIGQIPEVDVFLCSETLEHVEDPDALLRAVRVKANRLLLSTPSGEADSSNPEHYWGWTAGDLAEMLRRAGWQADYNELYAPPVSFPCYTYQLWRCQ